MTTTAAISREMEAPDPIIRSLAMELASIDRMHLWVERLRGVDRDVAKSAYILGVVHWVPRMAAEAKLYVHPDVLSELMAQSWEPTDIQHRMIWASELASLEGNDSKKTFYEIKRRLIKRHDEAWFEDVYRRMKHAFAARARIAKLNDHGPAVEMLVRNTILFGGMFAEECQRALEMVPKR